MLIAASIADSSTISQFGSIAKELCPGTYSQPCWLGRPQKSSAHIVPPVVCSKVCWRSTSVIFVLYSRLGCSTHSCLSRHASTCKLLHASSPASAPQRSCTICTSIQIDMQIKHYKHGSALHTASLPTVGVHSYSCDAPSC